LLNSYGWSERLQRDFEPFAAEGLVPGRVIVQQRGLWRLATAEGETDAEVSGRLVHEAADGGLPVAGDWVAADASPGRAIVRAVLPRSTAFTRWASGPAGGVQVVAANVDVAFLTASLNADLNLRRLERYLAAAYESGAEPVIVLTKADACPEVDALVAEVEAIAFGVPVLAVSAMTGEGLGRLAAHLPPGRTAVLLGSSGVGKSTLVNALAGRERMATQEIREDDARGRHTTTHRELILLPSGGLVLDTPGMRELGMFDAEAGVSQAFADLEDLAARCRFTDCAHQREPGCAVRAAITEGRLDPGRLASWNKLQRELAHERRKEDPLARRAEQKRWIAIHKSARARTKQKRGIE
jgi:ribosome biogenesis GTPase / thiamine phosphate phosphatase